MRIRIRNAEIDILYFFNYYFTAGRAPTRGPLPTVPAAAAVRPVRLRPAAATAAPHPPGGPAPCGPAAPPTAPSPATLTHTTTSDRSQTQRLSQGGGKLPNK